MKKLFLPLTVAALFVGCASSSDHSATAGAKPYPLKVCLVSDEKFDHGNPVVKIVNGQEIKFCCKDCVKDFDKDPAKYLTKLAGK